MCNADEMLQPEHTRMSRVTLQGGRKMSLTSRTEIEGNGLGQNYLKMKEFTKDNGNSCDKRSLECDCRWHRVHWSACM